MQKLWAGLLLLGILCIGRLAYLTDPYGVSVDESTYLAISDILNSGGTLYVDAVDRKPPGLFWIYQFIGYFFGEWNLHGVHFVFLIFAMVLVCLAGLVAYQVTKNKRTAFLAAFLFSVFSSCFPREIISSNAEVPMMISLAISLSLLIKCIGDMRVSLIFLAGLFGAASVIFKQYGFLVFIFYALAFLSLGLSQRLGGTLQRRLQTGGLFLVSGAVVYGLVALFFINRGAFQEFHNYFLLDGLRYVAGSRSIVNHATSLPLVIVGMLISWPLLWCGVGRFLLRSRLRNLGASEWIIVSGCIGAAVTIILSGRYYTHYFLPLIWFLSVWASVGLEHWWLKRKVLASALAFIPFLFFAVFNVERDFFSRQWSFSRERLAQMQEVGAWLESHLTMDQRVVVWGMASQIYVMAKRGSGTRFVFADFVSGRQPGYKSFVSLPSPGARDEFFSDLDKNKPAAFVDTSSAKLNDYEWFPPSRTVKLAEYLEAHYVQAAEIHGFKIFLRHF